MSKLTDIKNRIDQMDGGAFQNLCDAYLSYKGYKNIYSLGMRTGTDKTAKGNPDTYFLTAENKYVFVMYTTQKTDFLKKAIEDIDKCFDSQKTGVSAEDIVEIIYCHTYGRLGPGDDQYLRQYCEKHGAVLTLIGLDQLGNDIFRECPILARDFLGISIDSGQILPMDMFVAKHDANRMSAPLGTEFLFREKELEKAKTALHDNDVLLIAGPAGVGKTRFALELCRQLAEENSYTVFVIKNNNLQLYEDLVSAVEEGKDYLVLVDDANELSGLHHVLEYLPKAAIGSRHISKLILTVRDYARKQDLWMQHTIERYGHDKDRMCLLFTAIEELSCERRRKAVEKFLSLNANPDVFERLPLEPPHWGGTGSMIPYMQERIEYLRSLLPLVSGIKYLKHKQRIEQEIDCWKERIRSEEVRELLESWYH